MENCKSCDRPLPPDEKAPAFHQIVSTKAGLVGLSFAGEVWVYCDSPRYGWRKLPTRIVGKDSHASQWYGSVTQV